MAKLNNKGISLVELIIAIAVMALLTTPIVMQVASTLDNSANAKERQHAIEGADEVLEYFRSKELSELKVGGNIDDTLNIVRIDKYPDKAANKVTCELYDTAGTNVGEVTYYVTDYYLNSVDVSKLHSSIDHISTSTDWSAQKTIYDRVVSISDLNNKISEKKYEIDYQTYVFGSTLPDALASKGFTIQSDNTVCKTNGDDHITALVVKEKGLDFKDPNTVSLGNIQDLDASKIAVIAGDATSLDYKLENDLKSLLVTYAKNPANSTTSLGQVADDPVALNYNIEQLIGNATAVPRQRMIYISITTDPSASPATLTIGGGGDPVVSAETAPKYFHVHCDVVYKVEFASDNPPEIFNNFTSASGTLSYPILDRDYYVSSPPDIYMVYEPMLLSTKSTGNSETGTTDYAHDEYILISTDNYTGGYVYKTYLDNPESLEVNSKYDPSKLYLIKSTENWEAVVGTAKSNNNADFANYYCYTYNGAAHPVNIHINQQLTTTGTPLDQQLPIQVVTNVGVYPNYSSVLPSLSPMGENPWLQYDITEISGISFGIAGTRNPYPKKLATVKDENDNDADSIVTPLKDSRFEGKLYRMTVAYKKVDSINDDNSKNYGETIYLTGAKGAD